MRNIASLIKWLIILLLIVGMSFAIYAALKLNKPATTVSAAQDFEIKKGEHAGEIVDKLARQKLIASEMLMEIYLRWKGAEDKLQAGVYILDSNMTIPEIVQILSQGLVKASGIRLTVIEGQGIADIAQRLENLALMQREQFTEAAGLPLVLSNKLPDYSEFDFLKFKPKGASLEGFLFPDTYLVKEGMSGQTVAEKMLENFGRKVTAEMVAEVQKQKRNFYDALILASLVEREVGRNFKTGTKLSSQDFENLSEERRIVAGIFSNRLKLGMALQSDATVNYITGKKTPRASFEDIKLNSPYNTYKNRGLPPTPIANPSLDSIQAAINPVDTDYLYFLMSPDGTAYYGKTLQEHNANRAKYLQ